MSEIIITIERPSLPPIRWEGTYKGYRFFILGGQPEAGYIDILIHGKRARVRWHLAVERYLYQREVNGSLIIGRLVASFLETSPLYPPLLEGEGVGGEVQAERIKRQYDQVW